MNDTENHFLVLFITPFNVFLAFESAAEILKCDHSSESFEKAIQSITFMWCCL